MSGYRDEARTAVKETYWTMWKVVPIILIIVAIGFGVKSLGLVGGKMVERQVLVNSHQYIEGMDQRAGVLKANIAELDVMISMGDGNRDELMGQKRVLKAQLSAITK